MAQVLVNFRLDEEVKRDMEQACREMGLSMSTAFAIFAKKVGREKRIPFEIAVEPPVTGPFRQPRGPVEYGPGPEGPSLAGRQERQERLERLCADLRRSLTAIHTAIPSSITGLTMERIRLLCGDELKDKTAGITNETRKLFSGRGAELLREKDVSLLDGYIEGLSSAAGELAELERTLIPAMKAGRGEDAGGFEAYEQRLRGVSRELDELPGLMRRFLSSTACGAHAVRARIRQAARPVETPYILTALDNLEAQLLRHYDSLDGPMKARLEADYLPTLEHTLQTLGQAEQDGEDAAGKAALCLRAVNVLSQVISDARQTRREWDERGLEAEVVALERMAAMRGDVAGEIRPEA